jgi:hypothetical protein
MPIFIKFDGLEGEAHQDRRGLDRLGDAAEDLGGGFVKLVFAAAAADDGDLKFLPAVQLKHDQLVVGNAFMTVGTDFLKLNVAEHKFDDAFIKLADPFLKIAPSTDAEAPPIPLAGDFKVYEGDLKATGLDFWKVSDVWKLDLKFDGTSSLGLAFQALSDDFLKLSTDELKIGSDVLKIGKQTDSRALGDAFIKWGEDTLKLSDEYKILSADFQKLTQDFTPVTTIDAASVNGAPLKLDQTIANNAGDFLKVAVDLFKMNVDLGALGGDTIKLAEAAETSGNGTHFKLS